MKKRGMKQSTTAVSEIVGTMLLLIIAVVAFSAVYANVLSDEGPSPYVHNRIVSSVEGMNIVLEHQGGHPLSLDTKISFYIGSSKVVVHPGDEINGLSSEDKADGEWNVGEKIFIDTSKEFSPAACVYGSPALDFEFQEIEDPYGYGSGERPFAEIIDEYNGTTNLSSVDENIQWSEGQTESDITAIDPEKNIISFKGTVKLKHLVDFQEWVLNEDIQELTMTFEFVAGTAEASYTNTLFYYFDRDSDSRELLENLTNHGIGGEYSKGQTPGYTETHTVDVENFERIGFGIDSDGGIWHTNTPLNNNNDGNHWKQCIVYDLGKTSLGPVGSFLLGFEDKDNSGNSDSDFQDLVAIVHFKDCN